MAEVALGCRSPCGAIGIAGVQRITSGFGLGDSRLQVFESQLTLIRVQLLGPLAIESMAQFRDQVILALGMGLKPRDLGLHGQKRLPHGRRKVIQIKGVRERHGHTDSYRIRPQKPIFTRRSESLCRSRNGGTRRMNAASVEPGKQRLERTRDSRMTPSPTFGQAKPPCSSRL
jgi:hypothetical protein